jgi:hypothetical protein
MYVPDSITAPLQGPGRIVAVGLTVLLGGFAIYAAGLVGAVIVAVVTLCLLVVELWREMAALAARYEELEDQKAAVEEAHEVDRSLLEAAQGDAGKNVELEEANGELAQRVHDLEAQLASPQLNFHQSVYSLTQQRELIQVVQAHRQRVESGLPSEWPVTHIQMLDDGTVVVRALSRGSDPSLSPGETICLASAGGLWPPVFMSVVRTTETEIVGVLSTAAVPFLPSWLADELDEHSAISPSGCVLRLAGLELQPYNAFGSAALGALDGAISKLLSTAADALAPSMSEIEPAEEAP